MRSLCALVALASSAIPSPSIAATKLAMVQSSGDPLTIEKADRDASDGWFGSLAIVVRNTSDKPVCFVEYQLVLADVHDGAETMVLRFRYGRDDLANGGRPASDEKALAPSKTARLKLVVDKWSARANRMKDIGTPYNGTAVLRLKSVCFGDGMRWQDGHVVAN
jgi:hypothetical protein